MNHACEGLICRILTNRLTNALSPFGTGYERSLPNDHSVTFMHSATAEIMGYVGKGRAKRIFKITS